MTFQITLEIETPETASPEITQITISDLVDETVDYLAEQGLRVKLKKIERNEKPCDGKAPPG